MLSSHDSTFVISEDEWVSDDAFFNRGANRKPANGSDSQGSGTNIFGSGGGSQSKSESRGGTGGNVNEGDYCFLFEPRLDEFYHRLIRKLTLRLLLSLNSNYKK